MMIGLNIKKKYLVCQIPIKMLKTHAIPNSCLHNLKICSSKLCRKTSQRCIMYVANSKIVELWIFSGRHHFSLWIFASTCEYFYCWHWRVLLKVLQGKWCQDLQKPCSIISCFMLTNDMDVYCRLAHLTWVFKNHVDSVVYIIGPD